MTVVEDALGDETLYTYNARGQLAASEDADGVGFVYAYDANGLLLSVTDSLGRVTTYGRDALGRVTSVTEADGTASERTTTLTLDENGNAIATTDALSRTTTVEFDDFDRLIETTDAAGNVWAWTYDANGAVLTEMYNGKTTTHEYDALGRRVLTTDADGRETQFEYCNDGRLSRVIDGEGNATEYLYDALGRLVLTIAADGGTTEQRYDAAGNLLALIDPVGNVTSWLYDRTYRVVAEIDPLGETETESVSYDLAGRPLIVTDRLGRQKVYTYTDGGRIASEAWYDDEDNLIDTLSYIYNDDGRLYTASNAAGTYTFTYDDLGRVATVQDINGITLTYGWDEVDDLVTLSDSEGGVITSEYDEAHRLIERSQSGTGVESVSIQIDYDTEGRRGELRRYSDATGTTLISSTEYGYDNTGNLTSLVHKDDVGDPLVTYGNTFDDNNRITSETRNSVTVNYEYDEVNQVVDDDTNEYEYDLNGNRTMTGYTTGTGNRIETDGTWTYEYDLEGNLIKKSMGEEDETWEYGYDNDNRLLWAEKALTDGGVVRLRVEYVYDVFGNRVEQTVDTFDAQGDPLDSETSRYAFIGQEVWADLDENGDIVTRYLLGENFGERLARSGDGDTYWLLTDRLGSTREILDETGDLVDEISYDAFGNITSETEPGLGGDYLYTGLRWFAATALYGTPNRDYDPTIAKWLQTDPIGFNGGLMNLYGYVGNNGTNLTDLSGLADSDRRQEIAKDLDKIGGKNTLVIVGYGESSVPTVPRTETYTPDQAPKGTPSGASATVTFIYSIKAPDGRYYTSKLSDADQAKMSVAINGGMVSNANSIATLADAISAAVKENGGRAFDRIIIVGHGGGKLPPGVRLSENVRFDLSTLRNLNEADLNKLQRAIQNGLDPSGIFQITSCGYKEAHDRSNPKLSWDLECLDISKLIGRSFAAAPIKIRTTTEGDKTSRILKDNTTGESYIATETGVVMKFGGHRCIMINVFSRYSGVLVPGDPSGIEVPGADKIEWAVFPKTLK